MCGIAGFVATEPSESSARDLASMTDAIAHRGPDGHGYYHDAWAHLGHRRLSIIDVSCGPQPMPSAPVTLSIAYSPEIFHPSAFPPALQHPSPHTHYAIAHSTIL